jgi:hypothetical protein
MPHWFQRCDRADEITCTPPLGDAAVRAPTPVFVWFSSAFWQMMLWRRGPACFGPRPRRSSRPDAGARAASAHPAPSPSPPPRAARSRCDNSRFQGSPSVPQLALVMPTGSQRSAASAWLNDRKCRGPAPTISAMTSCRPRCLDAALQQVRQRQTACRPVVQKRQLPLVGGPFSRSKSSGCVLQ